jgi:cbb3-type cytochrome oxidase subunit 3
MHTLLTEMLFGRSEELSYTRKLFVFLTSTGFLAAIFAVAISVLVVAITWYVRGRRALKSAQLEENSVFVIHDDADPIEIPSLIDGDNATFANDDEHSGAVEDVRCIRCKVRRALPNPADHVCSMCRSVYNSSWRANAHVAGDYYEDKDM